MNTTEHTNGAYSALEAAIVADYVTIAGMGVLKDGTPVYEAYFGGCTKDSRINVFSVTKSVVSLLIGIALDRGYLKSLDQKILGFFPDYTPKRGERTIQNVTLRDMLTMTAPYKYKSNPYTKYYTSPDWVQFSLDQLGGKGRIGDFRYAPLIGPDILTGILTKITGQSVLDFARENLFAPLGLSVEESITFGSKEELLAFYKATDKSVWAADPNGVNAGGWGLTLSAMDLAKLGELVLNDGVYRGTRVVSEHWVRESTSEQSRWGERNLPYGYLWWVLERGCAAMGDGGNAIYISPEKNLVVAILSRFQPRAKDRIEFIRKYVAPLFNGTEPEKIQPLNRRAPVPPGADESASPARIHHPTTQKGESS